MSITSVHEDSSKEPVRRFGCFTRDLHELAMFLRECQIETVAMESTGVYWYHLYTVLLDHGFEVFLVNARHVKNVPGRKSDVSDARWLQVLHSCGLLKSCFQPDNLTRALRNYVRRRKALVKQMSTQTQRMQKALGQMNIKLNNVISDLQGKTGTGIISAILEGERALYRALGTEVTKIYGLSGTTALTVFSETGPDLKGKFPTQAQFLSWLNVVPDNRITGGKLISSRVRKKKNRAGQAFREAANALWNAKNVLGGLSPEQKGKVRCGQWWQRQKR